MKLTRFRTRTRVGFGAFVDGGIVDLGARMATIPGVQALLTNGALDLATDLAPAMGQILGRTISASSFPSTNPARLSASA